MSPRSWGFADFRINNPIGKSGLYAAVGAIVVVALVLLDVDGDIIALVAGAFGVGGAAGANQIRRQQPEYRDPNDD